jgi:hypothetical protein
MRYLTKAEIKSWYSAMRPRPVAAVLVNDDANLGHAWAVFRNGTVIEGLTYTLADLEQIVAMLRAKVPKQPEGEAHP